MIVVIKRWASNSRLNDPAGRETGRVSFSSYTLVVMTIGLLQMRGLLPNLQHDLYKVPRNRFDSYMFWAYSSQANKQRGGDAVKVLCDLRFRHGDDFEPKSIPPLRDALIDWFRYWADAHDYSQVLSIRHGGLITKRKLVRDMAYMLPRPPQTVFVNAREQVHLERLLSDEFEKSEEADYEDFGLAKAPRRVRSAAADNAVARAAMDEDDNDDRLLAALDYEDTKRKTTPPKEAAGPDADFDPIAHIGLDIKERWKHARLCVGDPFIRHKNLASPIAHYILDDFQKKCREAATFLEEGGPIDWLLKSKSELKSMNRRERNSSSHTQRQPRSRHRMDPELSPEATAT
ncbi:hypothetical protein WOLCODRAFT_141020 [Wolfiporia cocos MD-104 SS10]|uniref:PAP-associated domain-containing protein n=1 Tax=Wolfiporia cocos (strain MD-104) TaxID=742152 RepID=A0A2H3JGH9_WOLCO|nr:hypothetical protein WOLCODRAFT_141020 [Wolfiporia cocos MD-104 SS10]